MTTVFTKTRTIGHSHVLHPKWRDLKKSRDFVFDIKRVEILLGNNFIKSTTGLIP